MDTTPLRTSRDFRLLFLAGTVFYLGGMVSYVALPYQLYRLTGSNFAVGALGMLERVPLLFFGDWSWTSAGRPRKSRAGCGPATGGALVLALLDGIPESARSGQPSEAVAWGSRSWLRCSSPTSPRVCPPPRA